MNNTVQTPPHNIEAEVCTLGSMMLDARVIPSVQSVVKAAHFFRPAHQSIFEMLCEMFGEGKPVDLVSVREELEACGQLKAVGGIEYVTDLVSGVPNALNAAYYAGRVLEKARLREIITAACETRDAAYEPSAKADNVLGAWQQRAFGISDKRHVRIQDAKDLAAGVLERAQTPGLGLKLGIPPVDFATGGLRPGNYCILAARPGRGKTTLACNITSWLCQRKEPVLFVSMEMSQAEITDRLACLLANVDGRVLRCGGCNAQQYDALKLATDCIRHWPLRLDCESATVAAISAQLRRFRYEIGKPSLVVVDYFQLLTGPGRSRYEMFSEASRALKVMFGEHELPGLVLAQFRRPLEGQQAKQPHKGQLKETGALEQDADAILLLHSNVPVDHQGANEVWGCLDKNRHGPELGWPDEGGTPIRFQWLPGYSVMKPKEIPE